MNKQEQEQKRILENQKRAAKAQVEQRSENLLQKEFYAREWKAEIDNMQFEMDFYATLKLYKAFKDERKAEQDALKIKAAEGEQVFQEPKIEVESADTQI